MGLDDVQLQVVVLSELFVTDRADDLPILPDMLNGLPLNLEVDLPLVLLEVVVLREFFEAYSALNNLCFNWFWLFLKYLLIFNYLCLFFVDNILCDNSFFLTL